ncbi:hypothetical protein [Celerinatantimonas sp. YJH-8]|uniref:Rz1-like lysis system protein LysC n=1 Tax=Celerinatantimonas sp. YJH-8 TaxID=3228714 RepID=UPI0038C666F2
MRPPAEYLQPTEAPSLPTIPALNYDLVDYASRLKFALQRCNADKRSLRQWQATSTP